MTDRCVYLFHDDDGAPCYSGEGHLTRPDSHIRHAKKANRLGWRFDCGPGLMGPFEHWLREELAAGCEPRWRYLWTGLDKARRARDLQNACIAKFGRRRDGGLLFNRGGHNTQLHMAAACNYDGSNSCFSGHHLVDCFAPRRGGMDCPTM